jgi:hypothetical protein
MGVLKRFSRLKHMSVEFLELQNQYTRDGRLREEGSSKVDGVSMSELTLHGSQGLKFRFRRALRDAWHLRIQF